VSQSPTSVNVAYDRRGLPAELPTDVGAGYFEAGSRYRTRRDGRGDLLLLVTEAGGGLIRSPRGTLKAGPRSAVLYDIGSPQDYATDPAEGRWLFRFCHVMPRPHWWAARDWPKPEWPREGRAETAGGVGLILIDDDRAWGEVNRALGQINELKAGSHVTGKALAFHAAEAALLWCRSRDATAGSVIDQRVRRAIEHAQRHLDRRVGVDELADAASLSVPRLTVLFREQLGNSPGHYAEQLRLERAASLLQSTGLSIKEVSAETGFHDQAHFSRRFRRQFGRSPSSFRATGDTRSQSAI